MVTTKPVVSFIEYNNLNREDRLFFAHSGLDRPLRVATLLLSKRIKFFEPKALDRPFFSDEDLRTLDRFIAEMLKLIGSYSNFRYSDDPKAQDANFKRPGEIETFPQHLLISRWESAKAQLLEKDPKAHKQFLDTKTALFSKSAFKNTYANKMTFTVERLTETETRAVGVLYMINLIWLSIHKAMNDTVRKNDRRSDFARILRYGIEIFSLLDESDKMLSRSKGSANKNRTEHQIIADVYKKYPKASMTVLIAKAYAELARAGKKKLSRKAIKTNLLKLRKM